MPVQKMEVPNLPYLKRILYKGKEGQDVKLLQQRLELINIAIKYHPTSSLEDTGTFGRKTHSFVVRFQLWYDLVADGWVDKATADAIESIFQGLARSYADPTYNMSHPMWDKY